MNNVYVLRTGEIYEGVYENEFLPLDLELFHNEEDAHSRAKELKVAYCKSKKDKFFYTVTLKEVK